VNLVFIVFLVYQMQPTMGSAGILDIFVIFLIIEIGNLHIQFSIEFQVLNNKIIITFVTCLKLQEFSKYDLNNPNYFINSVIRILLLENFHNIVIFVLVFGVIFKECPAILYFIVVITMTASMCLGHEV
jgi:hypothetical protein